MLRKKIMHMLMVLVLITPLCQFLVGGQVADAGTADDKPDQALIIDPDAESEVTITSNYYRDGKAKITDFNGANRVGDDGSGNYQSWHDWEQSDHTYMNFQDNKGMTGIAYTGLHARDGGDGQSLPDTITVDYDNVGLAREDGQYVRVGAHVTVDNIIYGAQPSWSADTVPYIIFSNNLYSGVLYGGIKSMSIHFTFVDPDGKPINFTGLGGKFSFNSLNANQANDWGNPEQSTEFAGDGADRPDGVTSDGTILSYHPQPQNPAFKYMAGTYYGTNGTNFSGDDDHLGNPNFPRATVSFPLSRTTNSFTFGSGWGRAWTAFSSSSPFPVAQSAPSKTVEPVDNNAGFAQRYDNDLDVYGLHEGDSKWDFNNPQPGHNPDKPDLAQGVLPKAKRYVEPGKEYYYYINQPTIDLSTQGLVLPAHMEITDTLPEGTEMAGNDAVTVYDLEGNQLAQSDADGRYLNVQLSSDAVQKINEESKDPKFYGKDFTIRVKFKVTDDAPKLMQNKAASFFRYNNDEMFSATSNIVDIQLPPDPVDISFEKIDSDTGNPLPRATFTLYQDGQEKGKATSDSNGQVKFPKVVPGDYQIAETDVPTNYEDPQNGAKTNITVNNDGTITWPDGVLQDGKYPDKPTRKQFVLHLDKVDLNKHDLKGATFELKHGTSTERATTEKSGGIEFKMAMVPGDYTLKEVTAPQGFNKLGGTFHFTIGDDGYPKQVGSRDFKFADEQTHAGDINDWDSVLNLAYDGSDLSFLKDYGLKVAQVDNQYKLQVTIPDKRTKKYNLKIHKIDALTGANVDGADFKLTRLNEDGSSTEFNATRKDGLLTFMDYGAPLSLRPSTNYTLQETKAPGRYQKLKGVFTFQVGADGQLMPVNDGGKFKFADGQAHGEPEDGNWDLLQYSDNDLPYSDHFGVTVDADNSATTDSGTDKDPGTGTVTITIPDQEVPLPDDVRLPSTGGSGMLPYVMVALLLVMLGSGLVLYWRRSEVK
ncbi:MSCRAMM family protein [Lacticaseibacillus hulanensis]|uniref:MSCRAMM family protein n=1 Tax=Lacticaseibacillus hulanensis TaxID=2493111 RepID=UPI000FDAF8DA|nr:SpaA isopeptide-forming pilin-related protein [Lacticaseibacillus hulanensis]